MFEGEVYDAVGARGCGTQRSEVINSAAFDLRPGRGERGGRAVRASQPDDLMTCANKLNNGGGADPAGRSGDENTHGTTSS